MANVGRNHQPQARFKAAVAAATEFLRDDPIDINFVAMKMLNEGEEITSKALLQECWRQLDQGMLNTSLDEISHQTVANTDVLSLSLEQSDAPSAEPHLFNDLDANRSLSLPSSAHLQLTSNHQGLESSWSHDRFSRHRPNLSAQFPIDADDDDCVDGFEMDGLTNSLQEVASGLDRPMTATVTTSLTKQFQSPSTGPVVSTYHHMISNDTSNLCLELNENRNVYTSDKNTTVKNIPSGKDKVTNNAAVGATAMEMECDVLGKEDEMEGHKTPKGSVNSMFNSKHYLQEGLYLLKKEHELLNKLRKCSQCHIQPRNTTFLPCGHFTTCEECADLILKCPQCQNQILASVNTYLS